MSQPAADVALTLALVGVLAALSRLSLIAGRVWMPLDQLGGAQDPRWLIVTELRIPRTILAIAVGAALGLSGAALQGYTRNPLADPGVLGVSSMAALGAVLTLYLEPRRSLALGAAGLRHGRRGDRRGAADAGGRRRPARR